MHRSTASVPGKLREKPKAVAAAGLDGIEISGRGFIAQTGSPAETTEHRSKSPSRFAISRGRPLCAAPSPLTGPSASST